jgi:hypothetical protein
MAARATRSAALLLALACGATACGDRGQGDGTEGSAAPVPIAATDRNPPVFAGLSQVRLVGVGTLELSWEPAGDDVTPADRIRYRVFHATGPDGDPVAPLAESPAGAMSLRVSVEGPPGRFWVRAVDEAGRLSEQGPVLSQRARRPWLHAVDGSPVTDLRECLDDAAGAVCAGDDGLLARWTAGHWTPIAVGTSAPLRLSRRPGGGLYAHTAAGDLYALTAEGARAIRPSFGSDRPAAPLRQLAFDSLDLTYWIDAKGAVFVAGDAAFRRMARPLALADTRICPTLRALGFAAAAAFAVCDDGAVYSASMSEPGMLWLPLTSDTEARLPSGISQVIAAGASSAFVVEPGGVRHVGVGGWQTLLAGPGDPTAPTGSPRPGRIGNALALGAAESPTLLVPTDLGLVRVDASGSSLLAGTEGDVRGVLEASLDAGEPVTLAYADGSVLRLSAGAAATWLLPPRGTALTLAGYAADGTLLAGSDRAGVAAWGTASWQPLAPPLPAAPGRTFARLASARAGAAPVVAGADPQRGFILAGSPDGWTAMPTSSPAPAPPPPRGEDPATPRPPSPIEAARGGGAPPMEPIVDLDLAADGRGIAVSARQVWWLVGGTWVYLTDRPGPILHVALDADETYVLHEGAGLVRCWRHLCGAPVAPASAAPAAVTAAWHGPSGLVAQGADGATMLFVAATGGPPPGSLTPGPDTAAGAFRPLAPATGTELAARTRGRASGQGFDAVLRDDGAILERIDDAWIVQATDTGAVALAPVADGWVAITGRGLLRLSGVEPTRRP